ncbi:hypothetical protein GN244_ATG04207 [Phytophthora infestans]|uniref:Uncharacterized protein n=1 Tax=Phytophthora infestans TaxID=4787 RepID=A0A833T767_PHYIN|nr:hypothetical protein GN244_ATG04207 [Phytophthora infestans]KAF4133826.1 hypothetical protein GN958_ATG17163 [Phytophthora infestans]KAF4143960.1 hypothetical protein GN958_ATG06847 [Phytophthora infestans]
MFAVGVARAEVAKKVKVADRGFYYTGSGYSPPDAISALRHFAEQMADKVDLNCSRACALVVVVL